MSRPGVLVSPEMKDRVLLRREIARTLLPFVWLVVMVQMLLPVGTVQAMSRLAQDPFALPGICTMSDSAADQSTPKQTHGHEACPVCQIGGGGELSPHISPGCVPLRTDTAVLVALDPAQSAGPRGPPPYRPGARAPPTLS